VTGGVWVSEGLPNLVAALEKSSLRQGPETVFSDIGEYRTVAGNFVDAKMVLEKGNRVDWEALVHEYNILAVMMCLRTG
jgi:hypothetical protein